MQLPAALIAHLNAFSFFNETAFTKAHQLPAPTSIRLNPFKPIEVFNAQRAVPWCSDAFYLTERPNFIHDAMWHAGAYYVQEASSMFLQTALLQHADFSKQLRVLDLCAAPGGKSTLVASLLSADSLLLSNEVIQTRVNILAENIAKWGRTNTWVSNSDPRQFAALENYFDIILVDAPCSGSGLFRKDAAAIHEWSEANVHHCSLRQKRILQDVLPALKENGLLIYMTCSYSSAENEAIVDSLLIDEKYLSSLQVLSNTQDNIIETHSEKMQGFGYRFMPDRLDGEGFFLAAFKKGEDATQVNNVIIDAKRKIPLTKQQFVAPTVLQDWIKAQDHVYIKDGDNIFAMHECHVQDMVLLKAKIKLVRKGTLVGALIGKQLLPDHDLALSIYNVYTQRTAISNEDAILYMQKNNFELATSYMGWLLLTVNGLGIGWVKNLGNRFNNYFPKNMRVRKAVE